VPGDAWAELDLRLDRSGCVPDAGDLSRECLAELRACPPAPGFDAVEIPGERERRLERERRKLGIPIPPATLRAMCRAASELGVDAGLLD
jgi:LDH2 family malate/lactate/ureidoglycolate dehydrogenase